MEVMLLVVYVLTAQISGQEGRYPLLWHYYNRFVLISPASGLVIKQDYWQLSQQKQHMAEVGVE